MTFYGIASKRSDDLDDFFLTRCEAERALAQILDDEPGFADVLYIAEIDFDVSPN